jgi:hypothetical protein
VLAQCGFGRKDFAAGLAYPGFGVAFVVDKGVGCIGNPGFVGVSFTGQVFVEILFTVEVAITFAAVELRDMGLGMGFKGFLVFEIDRACGAAVSLGVGCRAVVR